MRALRLVLRGLWWRRGLTAAVLAVAVVTTAAAALGPMYARAAGESTLHDHLTGASYKAGLHVTGTVDIHQPGQWQQLQERAPAPGKVTGYDRRIAGIRSAESLIGGDKYQPGGLQTTVLWRQGECAHVVIVSGHCPSAPGDALMSSRTFDKGSIASLQLAPHPWRLGSTLTFGTFDDPHDTSRVGSDVSMRIVGTYRPKDTTDPYWFGRDYFEEHANPGTAGVQYPPTVDALLVSESTMTSGTGAAYAAVDFDYPLTASAVRLRNESEERHDVSAAAATLARTSPLRLTSGLGSTLDAADHERRLIDVATLLVTLQLGLLAWLVLFQVVADAIEARGNEIAMAKLRGHSPWATLRFGLGEPMLLLAAAVPVGIVGAWGITHGFVAGKMAPGTPVVTTVAPVLGALVAFAGGLVAAVLAGHRTLTRSVLDQWRRTTRRPGRGRLTLAADAVVSAAAIAGLIVLVSHRDPRGGHGSAALLAPGLLVLAVALIGVRLLPLVCRWLAGTTRATHRIGIFLASRQVARRPVGLRLAALLAVAVGLATFAVAGESVATRNRSARADAELGASSVASVQFESGHDPVVATQKADPDGRWAMAAATWLPDGGDSVSGTVLAVDSSRLAKVGENTAGGPTAATLARDISGVPVPQITTTARHIRVHLTATGLTGDPPQLRVDLRTPTNPYVYAYGSPIRPGSATYVLTLPCARGCTLRGMTWDRPIDAVAPMKGSILLTGIDLDAGGASTPAWKPVGIHPTVPGSWRAGDPEGQAHDRVSLSARGVRDDFSNENGGYGGIVYASTPSPIPAVATASALEKAYFTPKPPEVVDSSNTIVTFHVVSQPRVLPAVLTNGVVMDVRYLEVQLPAFAEDADWSVWIGPDAPSDAVARLRAAGLTVQHVRTVSARTTLLARQGPALALLLLLACAIAGAVLAAGATATSISASSRRRAYEIAALRAVGLRRRALVRASLIEHLLLLGTGVVLGVPAGFVAARLAMPAIPEFADDTPITLRYTPDLLPSLAFAGGFVVLLILTAYIAARAVTRSAMPARLRETEA